MKLEDTNTVNARDEPTWSSTSEEELEGGGMIQANLEMQIVELKEKLQTACQVSRMLKEDIETATKERSPTP